MREIIFRGKRLDNGKWVEGFFVKRIDRLTLIPKCYILVQEEDTSGITGEPTGYLNTEFSWYEVIPETVGQFTGLTDKNGNMIFTGDILELPFTGRVKVCFDEGVFGADCGYGYGVLPLRRSLFGEGGIVISNIHDNPELLKGE